METRLMISLHVLCYTSVICASHWVGKKSEQCVNDSMLLN